MLGQRSRRLAALASIFALVLLSCVIEEDLRINSDGSGTYRVRISMPKELGGFDELRKELEKEGFQVDQEGETDKERFIVFRKAFSDVSSLNDSNNSFELTTVESGFLRREYRLRATLQAVDFGTYKRRLIVSMPGKVQSASAGEVAGSRVTWEGSTGGMLEIVSRGVYFPLSANGKLVLLVIALGASFVLVTARRRRQVAAPAICPSCNTQLASDARFCRGCGAGAPVIET